MHDSKKRALFFPLDNKRCISELRKGGKKGDGWADGWVGGESGGAGVEVGSTDLYHLVKLHKPL